MCLYPTLVKNPKYKKNSKNGGVIPAVEDQRVLYVPIGCGKCMECLNEKAREWKVRLHEEIKTRKDGKMVTFTFSDESLNKLDKLIPENITGYDRDNAIATKAVRYFVERWRRKFKKSPRHWLVTELGQTSTERIHLHGIIFTDKTKEEIAERWEYGYTWIGDYVNERTVNYIVKYVTKLDPTHRYYKPKILASNKPGIGHAYITSPDAKKNQYIGKDTDETYRTRRGDKLPLPIYYRNKIYSEEERERLWIHKLDKEVRYVLGQKITIKDGNELEYYKALKAAQRRNVQDGYGKPENNWDKKEYENQRRHLLRAKRMGKNNDQHNSR